MFDNPVKILAFDKMLRLKAMFHSYVSVEAITGKNRQSIQKCCKGETISCIGFYWREIPEDIIVDADEELGKLTLIEFDEFIGVDRLIYKTSKMKKGETILESVYKRKSKRKQWKKLKSS